MATVVLSRIPHKLATSLGGIRPIRTKRRNQHLLRRQLFSSSSTTTKDSTTTTPSPPLIDLESPDCNIPSHIAERVLTTPKLYQQSPHPLYTIKQKIEEYFDKDDNFHIADNQNPIVSTIANFDSLLIPKDHVSRSPSDTYYVNDKYCLRTHTSAHQLELLKCHGYKQFLCTGDVYRRDDIDKSHYPIFHQMEGVKVFENNDNATTDMVVMEDLKDTLEGLAQHLFGPVECRWVEEYFPFTHPSLELEIWYQDDWLEVLGCGVMQPQILQNAGYDENNKAWAFGLGLERLAMVLFEIPDIRLFWTRDERFWNQFTAGEITKFQPYSKYPPCFKDVSFWLNKNNDDNDSNNNNSYHVNELNDLLRSVGGDLIETVQLVDQFIHPKTNRESHCYRITYRSMDRSLTNLEIDELQEQVRYKIQKHLNVELR